MSKINYSIIIPHKNIPDLLQRCLDSIPRREDIQIIVVDDNSDIDKVDFERFPGNGEPCVEVFFTKEGKGAGYARNVGLTHAKGRWLLFADADDFFTENIIYLFNKYVNSDNDIIYFPIMSVFCDTLTVSDREGYVNQTIQKALDLNNLDIVKFQRLEPWAKIISSNLVFSNSIIFDETVAANDLMFSVRIAAMARNVAIDKMKGYCLVARKGSLTYTISNSVCDAKFEVVINVNKFLINIGKSEYRINIFPHLRNYFYLGMGKFTQKAFFLMLRGYYPYIMTDFFFSIIQFLKLIMFKKSRSRLIKVNRAK